MKSWIVFAWLFAVMALCASCTSEEKTYTVNVAEFTVLSTSLSNSYDKVSSVIRDRLASFTPEEQAKLKIIDNELGTAVGVVKGLTNKNKGLDSMVILSQDFKQFYLSVEKSYTAARDIVKMNKSKFTPEEMTQLTLFDAQAAQLDKTMAKMLAMPEQTDSTAAVVEMGKLALGAAQILIPLIL